MFWELKRGIKTTSDNESYVNLYFTYELTHSPIRRDLRVNEILRSTQNDNKRKDEIPEPVLNHVLNSFQDQFSIGVRDDGNYKSLLASLFLREVYKVSPFDCALRVSGFVLVLDCR